MADTGATYPTSGTSVSVNPEDDEVWNLPARITADDGSSAYIIASSYDTNDISQRLTGDTFGFAVPSGATIDGIVFEAEYRALAGAAVDYRVQLLDEGGSLVGDNKASVDAWPAGLTIVSYGGSTDTWSWATVDADKINNANFGVVLSVKATAINTDIYCDFFRITVHYTEGAAETEAYGYVV